MSPPSPSSAAAAPAAPAAARPWIRFALLGFLGFGSTNFLLGCIVEWSGRDPQASISAPLLLWLAMGLVGLCSLVLFRWTGRGLRGLPSRGVVGMAAAAGLTLAAGMMTLKLGLAAEPGARGPLVAVASSSALLVALASRVLLGERLSGRHALGLLVIVGGVVMIGLSGGGQASHTGLAFGLLTLLCFGVTNTLLKVAGHRGADSVSATVVLWTSAGAAGLVGLGTTFAIGRGLAGLDSPLLVGTSLLAGLTLAVGMLGTKLAVTRGPGGPAAAIAGANAVLVALLERLVFGHTPPSWKLVGMTVAVGGIVLLALASRHGRR
ncbi:DMT family transporter [Myxococcota bacterium]|nr:DMT family transporter [Myxococcota bacterium]